MPKPRRLSLNNRRLWYGLGLAAGAVVIVAVIAAAAHLHHNSARLYLLPERADVAAGHTLTMAVHVDSGANSVNAVQANLSYDPAQLQFVGISGDGSAFGVNAQSSGGAGRVTIARATSGGTPPVHGQQLVATVTFEALNSSGSAQVSFAAGSAVVRSQGNTGLPAQFASTTVHFAVGSAAPTISPSASSPGSSASTATTAAGAPGAGSLYLNPSSGNVVAGGAITFQVRENSGSQAVNAIQADFTYPTAKFHFVSISGSGSGFGLQVQSSGDGGHLVIVRGIAPGSKAISGDQLVATVTLKATGSGSAAVSPAGGSALLSSTTNSNVLTTSAGATYQLGN